MKKLLALTGLLICGCKAKSPSDLDKWKNSVTQESQQRADEIISQLIEDCDSSLLQTAHYKADSIRRKLPSKAKR